MSYGAGFVDKASCSSKKRKLAQPEAANVFPADDRASTIAVTSFCAGFFAIKP
jgi:hypothetical protein